LSDVLLDLRRRSDMPEWFREKVEPMAESIAESEESLGHSRELPEVSPKALQVRPESTETVMPEREKVGSSFDC